jgi:hypothetical protein
MALTTLTIDGTNYNCIFSDGDLTCTGDGGITAPKFTTSGSDPYMKCVDDGSTSVTEAGEFCFDSTDKTWDFWLDNGVDAAAKYAMATTASTQTLTTKTIDVDDNTIADLEFTVCKTQEGIDAADDYRKIHTTKAWTVTAVKCITDPDSCVDACDTVVLDVYECDSAGDNCATILSGTITCSSSVATGTISDGAIAANAWLQLRHSAITENGGADGMLASTICITYEEDQ